jgi:hypothetical protein
MHAGAGIYTQIPATRALSELKARLVEHSEIRSGLCLIGELG